MNEEIPNEDLARDGEAVVPEWTFKWINPGRIEAGEALAPARLSSAKARAFAALNLILADLSFAYDCLTNAHEVAVPDTRDLQATAFIFSGVVAYARCFKTGVRSIKLDPAELASKGATFNLPIHDYLIALRDKHVAHSVNDFEQCEAVAVVIGGPNAGWRDGSGIGVVMKRSVGISRLLLGTAIEHVDRIRSFLSAELENLRSELYIEFKDAFESDRKWEMVPLVRFSDRDDIAKRRR